MKVYQSVEQLKECYSNDLKELECIFRKEIGLQKIVFKEDITFSKSNIASFLYGKDMFIRSITKEELKEFETCFLIVFSIIISDYSKDFYQYLIREDFDNAEFLFDLNRIIATYHATKILVCRYNIKSSSIFHFLENIKRFITS